MAKKEKNPLDTPMMKQYLSFKEEYPDSILFFRLGDFYEMFFDDAVIASELLGITLTTRHKGANIPLAGIPYHSADNYIKKLIDAGKKVAVCEQIEKPDKKKKTVARKVVRILTPGTVVEESSLDAGMSNYLLAIAADKKNGALVWVDVSCGDVFFSSCSRNKLADYAEKISAKEIISTEKEIVPGSTLVDSADFEYWMPSTKAALYLESVADKIESSVQEKALHEILFYLDRLYFGEFPPLRSPEIWSSEKSAGLDSNTIANLEVERTLIGGNRIGSLLWAIDRTSTSMGKRHLRNIIKVPLTNRDEIEARLDAVNFFYDNIQVLERVKAALKNVKDMERIFSRIFVKRGGPREIISLARSLQEALDIKDIASEYGKELYVLSADIGEIALDRVFLDRWINTFMDEPPLNYREGSFIRPEYSAEILELFNIMNTALSLSISAISMIWLNVTTSTL